MQAKGIIQFFLVLLLLVCASQFLYYIPTNKVEKDAVSYAQRMAAAAAPENKMIVEKESRLAFLDSMSSETIFKSSVLGNYTYSELKSKQLALGLDLKGGMSVLLQVDLKDFLVALSGKSTDPNFVKALDNAKEMQKASQGDYISLFVQEYKKLAGDNKLATIFARNESLKGQLNVESTDAQVQNLMRIKANETVEETHKRLTQRIDKLGVVQPNISLDKARDIIIVELPGIENPQRARDFLTSAAKLEFWEVYRVSDNGIAQALTDADNTLKALAKGDTSKVIVPDTSKSTVAGPLFSSMSPNGGQLSPAVIGITEKNKRKAVMDMLTMPQIASRFPRDLIFRWSKDAIVDATGKSTNQYQLYAVKKSAGKDGPALDGERVTDARAQSGDKSGGIEVSLTMDAAGAAAWGNLTRICAQDNKREVAILLDDEVVSAPSVNTPILEGRSSITGNYTVQEAQDFASVLQVGKLPAKAEIIQESTVGPSMGEANIKASLWSLGISFLAIMLFMGVYYSTGGIISIIALFANLFFIIGMLTSRGTVLTLPGIAGIVLTMGMAVDANVIIYERIREELAEGKTMLQAIADGFKNSMSAVVDGHVTAFLTSVVLIWKGLGPIKGFGVVLAVGVIFTLFTAVLVSRLITDWWVGRGNQISFFREFSQGMFKNINFDWMQIRKKAYIVSAIIIGAGIVSALVRKPAFEFGVDFLGGHKFEVAFDKKVNPDDLRAAFAKSFEGQSTTVKAVNTDNTFDITTSYLSNETGNDVQNKVISKLFEGVNAAAGGTLDEKKFKAGDAATTHIKSSVKVGPAVADDIRTSSLWTTIFGILIIGAYILVRFNRWQYALGIIIAAVHDAAITVSLFTLFHGIVPWSMEINQDFIAALLTIIGYSINDTVIVYDRIREYMRKYTNKPMAQVINDGINSTLSRTIITSFTVLLVTFILFLFGGSAIKGFAFALFVGLLAGTYSSIFIAAPVMMDFSKNLDLSEYKEEVITEGAQKAKKTLKEKA
ncbi:MAG: protein translocase subunit SecD [Saprospiraceae bacterium]|nr:protein translocase subunit SecD [Saprospiraceae bacterium]